MKKFILQLTLASVFLTGVASAEHPRFLRALSFIARDERAKAYPILEDVFKTTKKSDERSLAALVLSYASNRELKNFKRHQYAEFYLTGPRANNTKKDLMSVLRIAGDGYFDEAELNKAETYYNELAAMGDDENVDYAQYKLGWIDLNRNAPLTAFNRWVDRLVKHARSGQTLRDSMLRDIGKAWAETAAPSREQATVIRELGNDEKNHNTLVDGVISGLRRLQKPEQISRFRQSVFETPFATAVLAKILNQAIVIQNDPCSIVDWLDGPIEIKKLNAKDTLSALNRCFVKLKQENPNDWQKSRIKDRLIAASKKVEATGVERWARADFFREMSDNASSCSEFLDMENEHHASSKDALPNDAAQGLLVACHAYAKATTPTNPMTSELSKKLITHIENGIQSGLIGEAKDSPYYALVTQAQTNSEFRDLLKNSVLTKNALFKKTLFPTLVAATLEKDEKLSVGSKLFDQYAPVPLSLTGKFDEVWMEILRVRLKENIENRDYLTSNVLLERYIPLNKTVFKSTVASELWMLWALAVPVNSNPKTDPKGVELAQTGHTVVKTFIESLESSAVVEARSLAIASATKFNELESAWQKCALHGFLAKIDPILLSQFYQTSFDALTEARLKRDVVEKAGNVGAIIALIANLNNISELDPKAVANLKKETLELTPEHSPAFLRDIKRVIAMWEESAQTAKNKVAFNAQLPRKIEWSFNRINHQVEMLKSQTWSSPTFARLARLTIAESCTQFIADLEKIANPRGISQEDAKPLQDQIHSIVDMVKSWREIVLKDLPGQKTS
jgi:hypothetical protein